MRRRRFPLVRLCCLSAVLVVGVPLAPVGTAPAAAAAACPLSGTGRALVTFPPGDDAAARLRAAGASDVERVTGRVAVGHLRHGRPHGATRVEPELRRSLTSASDDTHAAAQWALDTQHADQAWARGSGAGVTVAVLDSGVDGTHPDLTEQVLAGADATVDPLRPLAKGVDSDQEGHGTAVAGIIAAVRGNGLGIAGLAPEARILPVKVGDESGVGTAAFVRGMRFAIDNGARIINLSFSGCGADRSGSEQRLIDEAASKGILVVAAAGNLAGDSLRAEPTSYPAAYANVIAVGATTRDERRAPYSVSGPFVDLSAPGGVGSSTSAGDVVTTLPPFPADGCPAPCFGVVAGTSFAAPYAAAVLALVTAAAPTLTPDQVAGVVAATSVDLGAPGPDPEFGVGRVDAAGALALALGSRQATRVAGSDRFATAAALSADSFPDGAPVAYLARGDAFSPDALAAGPAAIVEKGPVLLTRQCELPEVTATELVRLAPPVVVVLGGDQAVCPAVATALSALASRPIVRRVAGGDRFATAAALAADSFPSGTTSAYVARGEVFSPDALVGGTAAGRAGAPILLTNSCSLPQASIDALARLGAGHVAVLGGPAAVCDDVVAQLSAPGRTVTRLAGPDRYATAAIVAETAYPEPVTGVMVAQGDAFSPDALAAAPASSARGRPLLRAAPGAVPPPTANFTNGRDPVVVTVAGGPTAICDAAVPRLL